MKRKTFSDFIEESVHEFGYIEFEKLPKNQQILLCNAAVKTGIVDLCDVLVDRKIDFIKFLESSYKDSNLKDHYLDKENHAVFAIQLLDGYIESLKDSVKSSMEEYIYFLQNNPRQDGFGFSIVESSSYGSI